eukprot:TRINITY_DN13738_c0_g2_i1.p1 TRINITY_DN13738_c0_g2~~TRINITY_DN13738_c0_g2_i1.p1  ORF type:complete len:416 (+),score=56.15 TRINITY_DN13738_c0_g2_i1:1-1248(+)
MWARGVWSVVMAMLMWAVGTLSVEGVLVVANVSHKVVPWNAVPSWETFPLHSELQLASRLPEGHCDEHCYVLFDGNVRSTYQISNEFKRALQVFQTNGSHVLGILVMDTKTSPGYFAWAMTIPENVDIPVWLIGKNSIPFESFPRGALEVAIVGLDDNDWLLRGAPFAFWVFSLVSIYGICIISASISLAVLMYLRRATYLSTACLVFELVGNSVALCNMIFQWWFRPTIGTRWLTTTPYPFFLAASGLLVFFWLEVTSGDVYGLYFGDCLSIMKIPATAFITIVFLTELVLDLINFYYEMQTINAVYIIYICLCLGLGVLFFVISFKMSESMEPMIKPMLRSINLKARICGVLFIVECFFGALSNYAAENVVWYRVWCYLVWFTLGVIQFIQISIFFPSFDTLSAISQGFFKSK